MMNQQKSTFQGERGGDAYDAELLALLKGVSNNSGAADRFSGGDDDENHNTNNAVTEVSPNTTLTPASTQASPKGKPATRRTSRDPNEIPPWKRGKARATTKTNQSAMDDDIVIAAPSPKKALPGKENTPASLPATTSPPPTNMSSKSTFQGERGGDAHDEELLALLRGVSANSGAADRFAGGVDGEYDYSAGLTDAGHSDEKITNSARASPSKIPSPKRSPSKIPSPKKSTPSRPNNDELPPWKRGKAQRPSKESASDVDVVVAAKPPQVSAATAPTEPETAPLNQEAIMGGGGNFKQKSNFQGERGGDAHDEELLALLRGVSAKSSSADRFGGENNVGVAKDEQDVIVEAPPSSPPAPSSPTSQTSPASSEKKKRWKITPPWKKKNRKSSHQQQDSLDEDNVVVVAAPQLNQPKPQPARDVELASNEMVVVDEAPIEGGLGNFQNGPSTFQGERGGDAHDPELLALLRGASSSKANDRFSEASDEDMKEPQKKVPKQVPDSAPISSQQAEVPIEGGRGNFQQTPSTFQGERGGDAHDPELLALLKGASSSSANDRFAEAADTITEQQNKATAAESTPVVVGGDEFFDASTSPKPKNVIDGGRGNFKQESTFQGERGGDAHDAELLELLRGVSSSNRNSASAARQPSEPAPLEELPSSQPKQATSSSSLPPPFPPDEGEVEIVVTLEDLPSAFSDKNWKVRKVSYQVLKDSIVERTKRGEIVGSVDANTIVPGLDDLFPKLFAEKNAMALECAMQAGTEYANACKGGASEEQAFAMMTALLKGNGLSSPRPTSAKAATALVLKLMEVGSSVSSLKCVVNLLVDKGISAKKPKVVQLSASLILEATYSFGAAHLPLASITSALPKVLTHSIKKIRDTGMDIVAELCRSFGSKDPLDSVIEKMQKSQVKDLDALLAKRADPIPTKIGLRCQSSSGASNGAICAADVFAALQAGNEELEKERFAKRTAVKLMEDISKTEYASQLQEAKWSKKVAALEIVLKCGGGKPYKLAQPSSSNNYASLISDMKGLLKHTHFAVVSKALAVLGMLAQGVGEKLYPNIRPMLPKLLQLSRDKKVTKAVSACLDSCFGNVFSYEHLVDSDNSISDASSESKEKNALARTSALDYLDRSITRGESAGPRAFLTPGNAKACAKLAAQKLGDSDANVRKSALKILTSLQKVEIDGVQSALNSIIDDLQKTNPRAYKTLMKTTAKPTVNASMPKATLSGPKKNVTQSGSEVAQSPRARNASSTQRVAPTQKPRVQSPSKATAPSAAPSISKPRGGNSAPASDSADGETPSYEEALAHCGNLGIPLWDEPSEDEGGVLVGVQSTKWQSRQAAIMELVGFVNTCPPVNNRIQLENDSNCLLLVVKEHTKKFKESNMNVTKAILLLFSAVCDHFERCQYRIPKWIAVDATALAVEKVADRKLSSLSKALLLSLCVVHPPQIVILSACACAEKLRAPLAHEEFLVWMKDFCNEFGAASVASGMQECIAFLIAECGNKNIKVKRAAFAALGMVHVQLGPTVKAMAFASIKTPALRNEIEKVFEENLFDSSLSSKEWPRCYILSNIANDNDAGSGHSDSGMNIELPKTDLISDLPSDCLTRMGSKEGKTAWKARKSALEDVEKAVKNSSGLLDTSRLRPLVDLMRAMRERLSDSQSNLKPLAARLIGLVLGAVEGEAQGKLGKVVYGPIMNAAMNDKRKIMNDAAMEALIKSTSIPEVKGKGFNEHSLEPFVVALTMELDRSEFKSTGIAGIFVLTKSFAPHLPDLDKISAQRGETVGGRFARVLVNALSSSKAEIRSAAESLLSECISNNVFSMSTAKKCMAKMVPAKQRSVGMILAKIASSSASSNVTETSPSKAPEMPTKRAPLAEKRQSKTTERSIMEKPKPTARTTAPATRLAAQSKLSVQQVEEPENDIPFNPLVVRANPTAVQKSRSAMRSLTWPEYPEEPSGGPLYNGLKKAWAPIIQADSVQKLFPDKGIRNQSDVNAGFDVLRQAIEIDKEEQGSVVVEQLHFILRWSVFVMGCKESAVGLTGLLDMLSDLITYLSDRLHEFSDLELSLFVPFLFEKASIAKGRFKDTYMDLLRSIKSGSLIPVKRLGPLVCVPIMENSSQAKARLLACQNCHHCVEVIGLSGIGKKGVLVAAKAFSTEKLPENRATFLDFMVLLVSKMNNDIQRLSKICGSSLSPKARAMIEEHMKKVPSPSKALPTRTPSPQKLSRLPRPSHVSPPTRLFSSPSNDFVAPPVFQDELPALDLRRVLRERESPGTTPKKPIFASTLPPVTTASSYSSNHGTSSLESDLSELLQSSSSGTSGSSLSKPPPSPLGAAASLRARLMKIRERNNLGPLPTSKPSETIEIPMTSVTALTSSQGVEENQSTLSHHSGESHMVHAASNEPVLDSFLETIRKLLEKSNHILEDDDALLSCTDVLKNIHAAVSKQASLAVMIPPSAVENLRDEIKNKASEVVGLLTQLIRFGFHCHPEHLSSGMSVPLLSVNLASLMAIFRSSDLATLVSVDDLTLLIKEAGTALLDPRLAQQTKQNDTGTNQIDEVTSTQMVRAINKLAVQAATGATRENSIQALIRLQDQLSSSENEEVEDSQFNSRLSRVVTKLSTRVIKAEEGTPHPFSSSSMDMETILCFFEDTLDVCRKADQAMDPSGQSERTAATSHMVKSLVTSILKHRRECTSIRQEMEDLEIDPHTSALGELVGSIASDLGIAASTPPQNDSEDNEVVRLLNILADDAQGPERSAAIASLKSYRAIHGDKELMHHLEDVSPAFRSYIVKELTGDPNNLSQNQTTTTAMSERIKKLRSKLNATEGASSQEKSAQSVKPPTSKTLDQQQRMKDLREKLKASQAAAQTNSVSFPPSTSRPQEEQGNKGDTDNGQSSNPQINHFRERLAAAKEKQAANKSLPGEQPSPMPTTTSASSRAAALRARLQAVKQQNKL